MFLYLKPYRAAALVAALLSTALLVVVPLSPVVLA
jgi:hypothetical protein